MSTKAQIKKFHQTRKKKGSFFNDVKKVSANKKFRQKLKNCQNRKKKSFVKNVKKRKFCQKCQKNHLLEDKFGEAKLIIGTANVICGEATLSLLIKPAFGHFNQLL